MSTKKYTFLLLFMNLLFLMGAYVIIKNKVISHQLKMKHEHAHTSPQPILDYLINVVSKRHLAEVVSPQDSQDRFVRKRGRHHLVQLPMTTRHNGPYGAYHYNPDAGADDAYINRKISCGFQEMLKDWRDNYCGHSEAKPYESRGCRISFGNIAHKHYTKQWASRSRARKKIWPHKSHDFGHCIDIRPMRKGNFSKSRLNIATAAGKRAYDRDTTAKFIRFIQGYGASNIYLNDRNIYKRGRSHSIRGVKYMKKHNDHIHMCLKPENMPAKYLDCKIGTDGRTTVVKTPTGEVNVANLIGPTDTYKYKGGYRIRTAPNLDDDNIHSTYRSSNGLIKISVCRGGWCELGERINGRTLYISEESLGRKMPTTTKVYKLLGDYHVRNRANGDSLGIVRRANTEYIEIKQCTRGWCELAEKVHGKKAFISQDGLQEVEDY